MRSTLGAAPGEKQNQGRVLRITASCSLRDALALVDIRLLDHLIVGDGVCTSLAERGIL
jgi:DNA repair protein RadC